MSLSFVRAAVAAVAVSALAVMLAGCTSGQATGTGSVRPSPSASTVTQTVTRSPLPSVSSFATVFKHEQSGIVRIETLSCSDSGVGTGFLLTPSLVATVDHVINGAVVVSLIDGTQRTTGTVIGADPSHDLALVRANRPLVGHHFSFAASTAQIGSQVGVIGFPVGDPITFTEGNVSGLHRNITMNGNTLTGLIETDAAINPGNSGGPVLGSDGKVLGLVEALRLNVNGIAYAIPSNEAANAMQQWRAAPTPVPPATCSNPLGPAQESAKVPSPGGLTNGQADGVVAAFMTYFNGINTGNYAAAYAVLSPRLQARWTEQQFANGDATSYDFDLHVLDAESIDSHAVRVGLGFTSMQEPAKGPDGDSCDNWTLEYTMIQAGDGSWQIDRTNADGGREYEAC